MAVLSNRLPHVRVAGTDVTDVAKETIAELQDDDVSGLAAEMSYHSILAIFPFLLFLAGITALIDDIFSVPDLTDQIVEKAGKVMPEDAQSLLRSFTEELVAAPGGWAMAVGLFGSLWATMSCVKTAMKALNRAYDATENRGFVRKNLTAFALTITVVGLIFAGTAILASGAAMAGGAGEALGWADEFAMAWTVASVPVSLLLIAMAVALLYWLGPAVKHSFEWVSPGAILFVVLWIAASIGFSWYVSNFGDYNRTYGSIGAVILLLIWLYWTNFIMLVGAELNAVVARRKDREYQRDPNRHEHPSGTPANP
jgi:membrane protein